MSFETFDFHIDQKNLAGGFATSDEEQGADGRFRKTAWEVIHDFLYDYGIACDSVTIVGTAGFTRAKLSFRHNDGVEEIFQNHKWEIAESWRIKTLQKHLAPIMIFPKGENGMADLAYETAMSPDRPSYGNMIDHGATSLWEFIHTFSKGSQYDVTVGKIKSLNHHFRGDIAAWYITYIAGIRVNEELTDIYRVDISPYFVKQLSNAHAQHDMPYGKVISSWQKLSENKVLLYVELPEGAHGTLKLHDGWKAEGDTALCGSKKFVLTRG